MNPNHRKSQIPSSKAQSNFENPNPKKEKPLRVSVKATIGALSSCSFGTGAWVFLGIWNLGFENSNGVRSTNSARRAQQRIQIQRPRMHRETPVRCARPFLLRPIPIQWMSPYLAFESDSMPQTLPARDLPRRPASPFLETAIPPDVVFPRWIQSSRPWANSAAVVVPFPSIAPAELESGSASPPRQRFCSRLTLKARENSVLASQP